MDRRIERVADPMRATFGAPRSSLDSAWARSPRDRVRELVPVDRVFEPDPATREVYDRLYAEFPGLYKAQRKMFARLNGPRTPG